MINSKNLKTRNLHFKFQSSRTPNGITSITSMRYTTSVGLGMESRSTCLYRI